MAKSRSSLEGADEGAGAIRTFFHFPFAPHEGAEEGSESFFFPASNTISLTRFLASRFIVEIALACKHRA